MQRLKKVIQLECTVQAGVKGLLEEFLTLRIETQAIGDKAKTAFDGHKDKNRYKSVYCVDATRVKLTFPDGGDDYIHANWVNGMDDKKRYICTQGPLENTTDDFWRMAWQEKCQSVVMLCNVVEGGKKKCEKYWPVLDQSMTLPCKLTLTVIKSEEVEKSIILTRVKVTDEKGNESSVDHFHWKDWPDRGVPETNLSVFRLLKRLGTLLPIVVHCSAGVGRTGTIVCLDLACQMLQKGQVPNLCEMVREVRNSRHGSVQSDVQYIYIHRLLMAMAENEKVVTGAEIEPFVAEYEAMCKDSQFK